MISLMLMLSLQYAPTRELGASLDAEREARVSLLGKQLRCAVCQGVAIIDSPASMAQAQLAKVRELVAEGKTDEEVRAYFVQRYGEWVLLEPSKDGLNAVLWVGPLALLGIGLLVIVMQRKSTTPGSVQTAPESPAQTSEDPLLAQVRADLEK
jgi:cytochrome c-type biogenesis protein CcmH